MEQSLQFPGIPDQLDGALQENVLTLAAVSDTYCQMVALNVPLTLYSNEVLREIARGVYYYIRLYKKAPREHLPDLFEDRLKAQDTRAELLDDALRSIHSLASNGFNEVYVVNQLERFVRQQHLRTCAYGVLKAAEEGNVEAADVVIDGYRKTGFTEFNLGMRLRDRVRTLGSEESKVRSLFSLGIEQLDRWDLGPARGELHTLLAPPKRGKTWWLLHLAKRAAMMRLNVVYVTLEVSQEILCDRLLQSFFSMTRRDAAQIDVPEVLRKDGQIISFDLKKLGERASLSSKRGVAKVKRAFDSSQAARLSDNIVVQSWPTGQLKLKELETYLENIVVYQRIMPDVVIIDYADLMHVPAERYRLELGGLFKELRGMAVERNFALCTASQSNRASVEKWLITERDIAEDFSKVAISDVVLSYNQTKEEREAKLARLFVAAARNSRDRFSVGITQAYDIGQFCLDSFDPPDPRAYEALMPKSGRPDERDKDDSEDE